MKKDSTAFLKGFKVNIVVRILLLVLLIFALSFTVSKSDFWTLIVSISIAILLVILEFIRYVEKFKNHFIYFLDAINQEDFSVSFFSKNIELKDQKFAGILNDLVEKFRILREEGETRHQYLNVIVEHINIGILCYDSRGEITLINKAAKRFLKKPHMRKIESIKMFDEKLYSEIIGLSTNKKSLVKLIKEGELLHLSLQATEIKLAGIYQKVISIQDIKNELDEKEVDSWQKLVRIINHEIMNSVIPISTLANVLRQMLDDFLAMKEKEWNENKEIVTDVAEGIKTIEDRSKGLAEFVKATKSMTTISKPIFKEVKISEIFLRVEQLLKPGINSTGIQLNIRELSKGIRINGDLELIEQVLINLIKNGQEAIEKGNITRLETSESEEIGVIDVIAKTEESMVQISVSDNGVGIVDQELENVFIPFFTTKKNGSGIGLPLSRQIMRMHKGNILLQSKPGVGSVFTLIF